MALHTLTLIQKQAADSATGTTYNSLISIY